MVVPELKAKRFADLSGLVEDLFPTTYCEHGQTPHLGLSVAGHSQINSNRSLGAHLPASPRPNRTGQA